MRPSWTGHLRLSLVSCPITLSPAATETERIRLNQLNPKTGNRIQAAGYGINRHGQKSWNGIAISGALAWLTDVDEAGLIAVYDRAHPRAKATA
jgi:hypothetical protein